MKRFERAGAPLKDRSQLTPTIGEHASNTAASTPFATGTKTKTQSQKPQLLSALQTSQPFALKMIPAVTAAVAKSVLYQGSAGFSRIGH